jgi:uncharacterized protein (TIGR02001 family)
MMVRSIVRTSQAGVAALALMLAPGSALAGGSVKDEPSGRAFTWSFNIAGTTDYVFRGFSQTAEEPTIQGGVDIGYGILYAGIWASGVDFGDALSSDIEIDYYVGIKPVWGPVTFDLGVLYYTYPGASDAGAELDYVEIKVGASGQFIPNLTTGVTVFYSPEFGGEQGEVWTVEGAVAYELPKVAMFTPTIGGVLGAAFGDVGDGFLAANGEDDYLYWNIGLTLVVDKLTLDFRYWDTDIDDTGGFCTGATFQCDERFVFTAKITLP